MSDREKLAREALERQRTGDYAKTLDDVWPADDIVALANALLEAERERAKMERSYWACMDLYNKRDREAAELRFILDGLQK